MSLHATWSARTDVYMRIISEIISAIEAGTGKWRMPWHHDGTDITRPTNIALPQRSLGIPSPKRGKASVRVVAV